MKISTLSAKENTAITKLTRELTLSFPEVLKTIFLFGSKARGDFNQESDVDLLIILDSTDHRLYESIASKVYNIGFDHNLVFSVKFLSQDEYNRQLEKNMPFINNITRDGILLWKKTQKQKSLTI